MTRLDELIDLASDTLEKTQGRQRHMDNGLFHQAPGNKATSTIGVNGMNRWFATLDTRHTDFGHDMSVHHDHINERMVQLQESTGNLYNLEATPAEGTTYRFAREDQKRFPTIIQAGTKEAPYYTNSSQLPVGYTEDPFEALEMQEELQGKYTGGTVLHLYMGERVSSAEACKQLVHRSLKTFKVPYITITPTFSICPTHGYLAGEHFECPKCAERGHSKPRARSGRA